MRRLIKYGLPTVAIVLALVAAHEFYVHVYRQTGASRVADHPMPRLFDRATVRPYATAIEQQSATATRLMQGWWGTHGTERRDRAFAAWLRQTLPAPPPAAERAAETRRLDAVAAARTASGTTAAHWLQTYGGRDLWEYYAQQQAATLSKQEHLRRGRQLRAMLTLARKVGVRLDARLRQQAPFVADPALRPTPAPAGAHRDPARVCPCSYPAAAQVSGAAGGTFLGYLYPKQAATYRHMTDELGYAQVYLGSRLPSDVDAGALLGDLLGDYFLVSRGDAQPDQLAASRS